MLVPGESLDEDIELATDLLLRDLVGDLGLQIQELVVPNALDLVRDVVGNLVVRDRPRTRRVLEDVAVLVSAPRQQFLGQFVILIRLRREPNDDVPAEHQWTTNLRLVQVLVAPINKLVILRDRMTPVHHLEHPVRPGLRGNMDKPADARTIPDHLKHIITKVTRIARHESQALNRRDFLMDAIEQIRKGRRVRACKRIAVVRSFVCSTLLWLNNPIERHRRVVLEAVVVDGLSQQRDFEYPSVRECFDLVDDVFWWSMDLRAACVGDDAVGAELVAPTRDADIRRASSVEVDRRDHPTQIKRFKRISRRSEC